MINEIDIKACQPIPNEMYDVWGRRIIGRINIAIVEINNEIKKLNEAKKENNNEY